MGTKRGLFGDDFLKLMLWQTCLKDTSIFWIADFGVLRQILLILLFLKKVRFSEYLEQLCYRSLQFPIRGGWCYETGVKNSISFCNKERSRLASCIAAE